jgi:ribosomal protein S18 acetylase RimI-like enzyme
MTNRFREASSCSNLTSEKCAALPHIVRKLTQCDADALAKMQVESFPNATLSLLGEGLLAELYRRRLQLKAGIYLGVECDGKMVGFVCGGSGQERKILMSSFKSLRWKTFLHVCRRPSIILALLKARAARATHPYVWSSKTIPQETLVPMGCLEPPTFWLKFLAVNCEEYRNKGFGRELLKAFEMHAKKDGAKSIALGVQEANHAARSLYITHGMSRIKNPKLSTALVYYGKCIR